MKLITAVFASMLVFGTAACAKEEPKKLPVVAAPVVAAPVVAAPVVAAPVVDIKKSETPKSKRVCIKTTDPKTQKEVEKCRTVKIHEKHEGTKVPEKAPKK